MSFLRHILPILIILACGGAAARLYLTREEPARRPPPLTPVRVEAVRLHRQSYPVTVATRGTVRPRTESTLIPEVSGTIIEISPSFREGEFFEKGEILLTIDPLNYKTAVTVAQGSLAQVRVVLEEEKARAAQAVDNWKALGGKGQPESLVLRVPQVTEAEARVAAAEAELARAARDLERTTIRAPYAGRILDQNVDVGQYVSPGTVLARIYAVDYVEIRLPLTNDQLAFVDLPEKFRDDPASAAPPLHAVEIIGQIGGQSHAWHGRIVRVEGAIDERSRQLFVVAQVDDPYAHHDDGTPPLKIGLFVEARIAGRTLHDVFVLPRNAVRADSEIILIDDDSTLRRVGIHPVFADTSSIVVPAGPDAPFREGQLVCITPLSFAANGIPVVASVKGEVSPEGSLTDAGRKAVGGGDGPPAKALPVRPQAEQPGKPESELPPST